MATTASDPAAPAGPATVQARRRRTFAIISHPDAGKTTLTEKLLLYGGALNEAGSVKARGGRRSATSDWMQMEQERGISVTSTALRFEVGDVTFNLLDTPGHKDFSEDTLRVLAAADCAVMVLDGARGVEPQTLRLFEVARARRIPLLTLVNKLDRPGMEPLEMLDHIETTLGLRPTPVTWPVGIPGDMRGIVDRRDGLFHRYTKTVRGAKMAPEEIVDPDRAALEEGDAWTAAQEELALLDAVGADFDAESFRVGDSTPVFFGSAVSNFGIGLLLQSLVELAPSPSPRLDIDGERRPLDAPFSGFVFKIQANMDPRHRDRVAFIRICSGKFERGMRVMNSLTGKPFTMAHAHQVFAQDRSVLDEAWPGDVIGVINALDLRIGDTLYDGAPVTYPPIPTLAPEQFAFARSSDASRRKQFRKGLDVLGEEGVVHVLHRGYAGDPTPILAGVGQLQFEVAVARMKNEFGVEIRLEPAPYTVARRTDEAGEIPVREFTQGDVLTRSDGTLLAVFRTPWALQRFAQENPDVLLDQLLSR